MKITLLAIGKTNSHWIDEGISLYAGRLKHYLPFEIKALPDLKSTRGLTWETQKEKEGEAILRELAPSDHVVLLDERGKELTSLQLATALQQRMSRGFKRMVLVIGGPYGFSPAVYTRADGQVSLSKMTMTHEMARLFCTEQLYRAMTILRGKPYHHE